MGWRPPQPNVAREAEASASSRGPELRIYDSDFEAESCFVRGCAGAPRMVVVTSYGLPAGEMNTQSKAEPSFSKNDGSFVLLCILGSSSALRLPFYWEPKAANGSENDGTASSVRPNPTVNARKLG